MKARVRKRSPLLREPSREPLAQHADSRSLPASVRFRPNFPQTSTARQASSQRSHTPPLAFADRRLLSSPLEVFPDSARCRRWQTARLLVVACRVRWCEMLRSRAAPIGQYLSPNGSRQGVVEKVEWRSDALAIQTDLGPPGWPQ